MGGLRMNRNVFEALNSRSENSYIKNFIRKIPRRSRSRNYFDVYFYSFELHTSKTLRASVESDLLSIYLPIYPSIHPSIFLCLWVRGQGRERHAGGEGEMVRNKLEDLRTKAEYGMERARG